MARRSERHYIHLETKADESDLNKEVDLVIENKKQPLIEPEPGKVVNILQDITIVQMNRENLNTEKRDQGQKNDDMEEKLQQIEKNKGSTQLGDIETAEIESDLKNKSDLENNKEMDKKV